MRRVRMFGDWDDKSQALIDRLIAQTPDMIGNCYKDVEFVADGTYEYAIVFNYPTTDLIHTPPERTIGLVLEPPEISDWMHTQAVKDRGHRMVGRYFSFADVPEYEYAPCLGFTTTGPWILGELPSEKNDDLRAVMVASTKTYTPYHLKRRQILDALLAEKALKEMAFYGRGMEKCPTDFRVKGEMLPMQKHIVIEKYAFCIDFENSPLGVVTDKFFDPILRNTIPITNAKALLEYGTPGSFEYVDFDDSVDAIVKQIKEIISQRDLTCYDKPLLAARRQILQGDMCLAKWITERVSECAS